MSHSSKLFQRSSLTLSLVLNLFSIALIIGAVTACDDDGSTTDVVTVGGEVGAGESVAGESVAGAEMPVGLPLDSVIPETATAMCQGLLGCCDMSDHEMFFLPIINSPRYEEVLDQLPPAVEFNEGSCQSIIETLLTAAPFGRWVEQVNAGRVSYDGEAAQTCLDTLSNAQCGDEFLLAATDSTCFSPSAPVGGDRQRKMFTRDAAPGAECVALTDGQGGVVYGTCDPSVAFCCVRREDGTCKVADQDEVGECVAVSARGEACGIIPNAQFCATGDECAETGLCEAPTEFVDVQVGEMCAEGFNYFGNCIDSYCDLTGTGTCLALKADGESCVFSDECVNGACIDQVCGVDSYCR